MELNMVYVVSERPAVGRSGPMVDPEGLSRYPSLIPDWPCRDYLGQNSERKNPVPNGTGKIKGRGFPCSVPFGTQAACILLRSEYSDEKLDLEPL